jgi:hypothetical protein
VFDNGGELSADKRDRKSVKRFSDPSRANNGLKISAQRQEYRARTRCKDITLATA